MFESRLGLVTRQLARSPHPSVARRLEAAGLLSRTEDKSPGDTVPLTVFRRERLLG